MKRSVNDAVLIKKYDEFQIVRVFAFTTDGKAVCHSSGTTDRVITENGTQWPKVGHFKRGLFGWRFIPLDSLDD